jgi:antirestriction protein ArdC
MACSWPEPSCGSADDQCLLHCTVFCNVEVDANEQDEDQRTAKRQIPILRYYTVFNVTQCEGIDVPDAPADLDFQPIASCEDVAARMPEPPTLQTHPGRACYAPTSDTVSLPPPQCAFLRL